MTEKQKFLIEEIQKDMVQWLIQERNLSLADALNTIYNSETFEKIQNVNTGLYLESSAYNYNLLEDELKFGKLTQMEI